MRHFIKHLMLVFFILTFAVILSPQPAQAQTETWTGKCVYQKTDGDETYTVATIQGLECAIANILSVAITAIGLGGFVMLIFGSFKYLLSGGNSQSTQSARNTITYAVLGLIIALSSFFILNLIAQFTGVDTFLHFYIPDSDTGL